MGKRERKISVIKQYINNVSSWPTYAYGSIPSSIASNASRSYGGAVTPNNILGLVDITVTGNGQKGLIFAEHHVYFNNGFLGSSGSISYREIAKTGKIPSDIFDAAYNKQALIGVLSKLADIEGKDLEGTMSDIDKGLEEVENIVNLFKRGKQIWDSLKE